MRLVIAFMLLQISCSICECENEGKCLSEIVPKSETTTIDFCQCPTSFVGIKCENSTIFLQEGIQTSIKLDNNYTLISFQPKSLNLYHCEIELCVQNAEPNFYIAIFIEVENQNGLVEMSPSLKDLILIPYEAVCNTLDLGYLPFGSKQDGEIEKLVVGIKLTKIEINEKTGEKELYEIPSSIILSQATITVRTFPFFTPKMMVDWLLIGAIVSIFIFLVCLYKFFKESYCSNARRALDLTNLRVIIRHETNGTTTNSEIIRISEINQPSLEILPPPQPAQECPVCLCLLNGSEKEILTHCNHEFHFLCLEKWLEMNSTCPVCRSNLFKDISCIEKAVTFIFKFCTEIRY